MKTAVTFFILTTIVFSNGCGLDNQAIVAKGPNRTGVYSEAETAMLKGGELIAELNPGDTVKALDYTTLKQWRVYKIELKDGRIGWVVLGDNCDVIDLRPQTAK